MRCVGVEKCLEVRAIGFDDSASAFADFVEVLECDDAENFGRMHRRRGEEIVEFVHRASQVGLRQNPAAAKTAEAVNLRQAAGHDEILAEMK